MKYTLLFIHSVYSDKLMYTTNYDIPSCMMILKVNTFFCQIPSDRCTIYVTYGANFYFNR